MAECGYVDVDNIYQGTVSVQHAKSGNENGQILKPWFHPILGHPFSKMQCFMLPSIMVIILQPLSKITERLL